MANLLHIQASPSYGASRSNEVAQSGIAGFQEASKSHTVRTLNVWDLALPPFDATMIAAKFAVLRSEDATEEQRTLWGRAVALSQAFNEADRFVFSVPMWNFGVPYQLKHYIDVVTLPGQNWSWSREDGYTPLLHDKRALIVYSSAGHYPLHPNETGAWEEFQKPFMRKWLAFIGIDLIGEISVGPTLSSPEALADLMTTRKAEAASLGSLLALDA